MKVFHINAVYEYGSTGRFIYELKHSLQKYEVDSLVATTKTINKEDVYIIGNRFDWKCHGFFSRLFGKQGYFSLLSTKKLLKKISCEKPEIIHLHNLHANYINFPMLMKYIAKCNIPLVVTLHDCWFFTGKCCHYTVDNCYKWKTSCHHCPSLKKYNRSWFFDRTPKMHKDKKNLFSRVPNLNIIGVSHWLTEEAKKAPVFATASRIECIYNWVDTEKFSPKNANDMRKELSLENKKIILSVASAWSSVKGLNKICEIAKLLEEDEQIILVGRIGNEDKEKLPDNVICLPPTNSIEELAIIYSMADVLFQPSLEETFGLVVAEAMACGTPAVCYRSTANPELISEATGAVSAQVSAESALKSIRQVLNNGKTYYSEVCRKFAIENFEKHKNTEKYYELYKDILENN